MKKNIIHVVGARPNFIKAAPVIKIIGEKTEHNNILLHTGQHYDDNMSNIFFDELNIPKPDYNLGVGSGSHAKQTTEIMLKCEDIFQKETVDYVIVYGDVNSSMAAALTAVKLHIPVIHIESGLRSFDKTMPEEINRIITDHLAEVLFVTSVDGVYNLSNEGILNQKMYLVGNTMIDTLVELEDKFDESKIINDLNLIKHDYVLITLHRASNTDDPIELQKIMESFVEVSKETKCVFPMHPRTKNNLIRFNMYEDYLNIDNLNIIEPLGYIDFMCLQKNAKLIITDSGGIQEESSYFGVTCMTMRDNTERPVTITSGTNKLMGTDFTTLPNEIIKFNYNKTNDIYLWDGKASERIFEVLKEEKII
jgi:UDP-N-acetylglucosamine 2-epimerase (non-hydrolysing)